MGLFLSSQEKLILRRVCVEYYRCADEEKRQALLEVLQNNDYPKEIEKSAHGDLFANSLVWAGQRNHPDILKAFLDQGMNIDIKNIFGYTALIQASTNGHEESVRLLLNHNLNPNIQIINE